MLYRVNFGGKSVVYATDVEQKDGGYPEIIEFARGADLLIHDAQYRQDEYLSAARSKKGWGHSTIEMAAEVAKKAGVRRLALFHHEPSHDDKTMRVIEREGKRLFPQSLVAHERLEILL
jgi:ribonuclease BN (tRNA processing enzyme)